jgi:hypothetical protein
MVRRLIRSRMTEFDIELMYAALRVSAVWYSPTRNGSSRADTVFSSRRFLRRARSVRSCRRRLTDGRGYHCRYVVILLYDAMKIIDAQVHIWSKTPVPTSGLHRKVSKFTAEELLDEMDEAGVDAALIHPPSG